MYILYGSSSWWKQKINFIVECFRVFCNRSTAFVWSKIKFQIFRNILIVKGFPNGNKNVSNELIINQFLLSLPFHYSH